MRSYHPVCCSASPLPLMASNEEQQLLTRSRRATVFWWPAKPKPSTAFGSKSRPKRRKLPSIRLGGKCRKRARFRFCLAGVFRRLRIRWLRLRYWSMIRRLKVLYTSMLKELVEARTTLEELQKRIMLDTQFAVPVIGIGAAGVPYNMGAPRQRQRK